MNDVWKNWTQFDKFSCLIVVLAASAPFLNQMPVEIEKQAEIKSFAFDFEQKIRNDFEGINKFVLPSFDSSEDEKLAESPLEFDSDDNIGVRSESPTKKVKKDNMQVLMDAIWHDKTVADTPSKRTLKRTDVDRIPDVEGDEAENASEEGIRLG